MQINENAIKEKSKVIQRDELSTIKCSNCNKPLLNYVIDKLFKENLYSIVVDCPFCKDKSFALEINGAFKYIPLLDNTVRILDVETDEKTKTVRVRTTK